MNISAKSVHNILINRHGALHGLVDRCERLQHTSALVRDLLPEPIQRHCRVANLADGIMVIHTDAPIWTTRLRFHRPHLLTQLRRRPELGRLDDIQIRTTPKTIASAVAVAGPARVLPAEAASQLRATASSMPGTALKEALLRLAARADPSR